MRREQWWGIFSVRFHHLFSHLWTLFILVSLSARLCLSFMPQSETGKLVKITQFIHTLAQTHTHTHLKLLLYMHMCSWYIFILWKLYRGFMQWQSCHCFNCIGLVDSRFTQLLYVHITHRRAWVYLCIKFRVSIEYYFDIFIIVDKNFLYFKN